MSDPRPFPAHMLADDEPSMYEVEDGRWHVTDEGSANWAMAKLAEMNAHIAAREEQARLWSEQVDRWLHSHTVDERRFAQRLDAELARWGLDERERNPKVATIKLLAGDIATTSRKPTIEIDDQEQVVAWCKASGNAELVQIKESVLVSKLRGVLQIHHRVTSTAVMLSCGHERHVQGQAAVGEMVTCDQQCHYDGGPLLPIMEILFEATEAMVIPQLPLTDDQRATPVPGTRVNPARTDASVRPRS